MLRHVSNYTDFAPLAAEPDVRLRPVPRTEEWGDPDVVMLPGSKSVVPDLDDLRRSGLADNILGHAERGKWIFGICGGLQILGRAILDPHGIESAAPEVPGLGLMDLRSTFAADKTLVRVARAETPLGVPSGGYENGMLSLILPAFTIGAGLAAFMTRSTRSSMLDVIRQDYLRMARAKGVSERNVIRKHALRNALIPIITVFGVQFSNVLGGSVLAETVFAWPGVGRLVVDAIDQRDIPMVTGALVMTTMIVSIVNLLIDIVYAFVDPRIKSQYTK